MARNGSHYAPRIGPGQYKALCGFQFTSEEAKPITGEPSCRECLREAKLAARLGS